MKLHPLFLRLHLRPRLTRILFTLLAILVAQLLVSTAPAAPEPVNPCSELAAHLQRRGANLETMPVVDCPAAINENSAEHLVCQVIESRFYKWKEFEFQDATGETRLAIKMLEPETRRLTATEAGILLNASKHLFTESRLQAARHLIRQPDRAAIPASTLPLVSNVAEISTNVTKQIPDVMVDKQTEITDRNPFPENRLTDSETTKGIIGTDDRVRVTSFADITTYPWNTICYIESEIPLYAGSGILIAPHCVLTCGHVLLPPIATSWAQNMSVYPAMHQDHEGTDTTMEFGIATDVNMVASSIYIDTWDSAFDYGMILTGQSFSRITTFMPIEYDATPTVVEHAGYPSEVQNESDSYDMWFASGRVTGYSGTDNRVMEFDLDITHGQSGGPAWIYDLSGNRRLVAIISHFCPSGYNGATRLVSAMESVISNYMRFNPDDDYQYFSYIPYYLVDDSHWTGIALANSGKQDIGVKFDYYDYSGMPMGSEIKTIPPLGQKVFAIDLKYGPDEGWVKISSTAQLAGLALIGNNEAMKMFDIDLKTALHRRFICPHLAVNKEWISELMVCNPNQTETGLTLIYRDTDGTGEIRKTASIPAEGSLPVSLAEVFNKELNGGTLTIEATQPISTFLLYDNRENTWRAGLSAVPLD
ncbi:MAG: hypothetical protein GXO34_05350 [Deltaproteobacteria bacterium]|nr:hypothetical protein [Deltaproteobacteria bacterium]